MDTVVTSFAELEAEAVRFLGSLTKSSQSATLVTLSGELGAGKTAFTKAVATALGVEGVVTSPTFVLEKIYLLPQGNFKRLIHIDAYRLESGKELAALGFDELMQDAGNLILLEWPEKVGESLPVPAAHLSFFVQDDDSRIITHG